MAEQIDDQIADEQTAAEQTVVDSKNNRVSVRFDRGLYPLDSVYGAAYVFIDRCYVLLDAVGERAIEVQLRGREPLDEAALTGLAGEFGNELLTQAWRHEITERNRLTIETVTLQALAGASGQPLRDPLDDLDDLQDLDDLGDLDDLDDDKDLDDLDDLDDDVFDDPLGIAVPWEEKYSEGKEDAAAEDTAAEDAAAEDAPTEDAPAEDAPAEDATAEEIAEEDPSGDPKGEE